MAHQFSHYIDRFVLRADSVQLDQLTMTQLLHYLSLSKEVFRVHRTYNTALTSMKICRNEINKLSNLVLVRCLETILYQKAKICNIWHWKLTENTAHQFLENYQPDWLTTTNRLALRKDQNWTSDMRFCVETDTNLNYTPLKYAELLVCTAFYSSLITFVFISIWLTNSFVFFVLNSHVDQ